MSEVNQRRIQKDTTPPINEEFKHYYKDVSNLDEIDVYDVLDLFEVINPATQHAIKKLLVTGKRGHKGTLRDLNDALASISKAIKIEERKL